MKIFLDLDFDNKPIIELESYGDDSIDGKTLRRFIVQAKKHGLIIKDNCMDKDCENHAEIRIKGQ